MRLIWARMARDDLFDIADYYERIDPALADALLDRIEEAAEQLIAYPDMGSRFGDAACRKWLVRRSPYLLIYTLRSERIEILRVRHGASDWRA